MSVPQPMQTSPLFPNNATNPMMTAPGQTQMFQHPGSSTPTIPGVPASNGHQMSGFPPGVSAPNGHQMSGFPPGVPGLPNHLTQPGHPQQPGQSSYIPTTELYTNVVSLIKEHILPPITVFYKQNKGVDSTVDELIKHLELPATPPVHTHAPFPLPTNGQFPGMIGSVPQGFTPGGSGRGRGRGTVSASAPAIGGGCKYKPRKGNAEKIGKACGKTILAFGYCKTHCDNGTAAEEMQKYNISKADLTTIRSSGVVPPQWAQLNSELSAAAANESSGMFRPGMSGMQNSLLPTKPMTSAPSINLHEIMTAIVGKPGMFILTKVVPNVIVKMNDDSTFTALTKVIGRGPETTELTNDDKQQLLSIGINVTGSPPTQHQNPQFQNAQPQHQQFGHQQMQPPRGPPQLYQSGQAGPPQFQGQQQGPPQFQGQQQGLPQFQGQQQGPPQFQGQQQSQPQFQGQQQSQPQFQGQQQGLPQFQGQQQSQPQFQTPQPPQFQNQQQGPPQFQSQQPQSQSQPPQFQSQPPQFQSQQQGPPQFQSQQPPQPPQFQSQQPPQPPQPPQFQSQPPQSQSQQASSLPQIQAQQQAAPSPQAQQQIQSSPQAQTQQQEPPSPQAQAQAQQQEPPSPQTQQQIPQASPQAQIQQTTPSQQIPPQTLPPPQSQITPPQVQLQTPQQPISVSI